MGGDFGKEGDVEAQFHDLVDTLKNGDLADGGEWGGNVVGPQVVGASHKEGESFVIRENDTFLVVG